jgi:apolipoprotein D and lipocalin family protein
VRFEKDLKCVSATYSVRADGKVDVLNEGQNIFSPGRVKKAKGLARVPDPAYPGRLKVSFFWPFSGDYYIIQLDENYRYALVGAPSRKYLWILCRTREMDSATYFSLIKTAEAHGFDTTHLVKTIQDC